MSQKHEKQLRQTLIQVTAGETLSRKAMTSLVDCLMSCNLEASPLNILSSALLCSLKTRGETVNEIVGAASSLRQHQVDVPLSEQHQILLDTCGTGGDGAHLLNISTITGLVVASLGVKVAKHGNRSVSSSCGSADLLEHMGYPLLKDKDSVSNCVSTSGFGFFFAPHFHPALKNLSGLRRSLGVRTLFNMLGPLVNPAGATHQLIGVFDKSIVSPIAQAASSLGVKRCLVVHGEGGLDELSPSGTTWASLAEEGKLQEFEWTPSAFGAKAVPLEALAGGNPQENSEKCEALFRGELKDVASAVAMNCAACLWLVGDTVSLKKGYAKSYEAIQNGSVGRFFQSAKDTALTNSSSLID